MILETNGFSKLQRWLFIIACWFMVAFMAHMAVTVVRQGGSIFHRLETVETITSGLKQSIRNECQAVVRKEMDSLHNNIKLHKHKYKSGKYYIPDVKKKREGVGVPFSMP